MLLLNLLGPRHGFEGGLFLPDDKSLTARRPIETVAVTEKLRIPLRFRTDLPTEAVVKPGMKVGRGQWLSRPASLDSVPAMAPTSGTILELGTVITPLDGMLPCAVLEPDGRDEPVARTADDGNDSFIQELVDHGAICSKPRMAAHTLIQRASRTGVNELIVNGMETEPYLTSGLRMLVEDSERLLDGAGELADSIGASRCIIAVPFRHRRLLRRIEQEARGRQIDVVPLADKYPQCNPVVLVKTLLDYEVPPGGEPLDNGVLVAPLDLVGAVADARLYRRPMTHVVMTVAGDAVDHPGTYRVAIGTPFKALSERISLSRPAGQVIWGGPLTGIVVTNLEAVVTADTKALLFFSTAARSEPIPCIHCGWCVDDCPVGLHPIGLSGLNESPRIGPQDSALLKVCVDCGLCSYVCPAQLPLAQAIRKRRAEVMAPPDGGQQL